MDNNKKNNLTIIFVGSNRYGKIIEPLRKYFNIVLLQSKVNAISLFWKLFSSIRHVQPDVILCDDYQGVKPVIVGITAKISHIPYIIRPRGAFWHRLHDRYEDSFLAIFCKVFFWTTRAFVFYLADGVLPVSRFLRDQVIDRFNIEPKLVIAVGLPVDLERFHGGRNEDKENVIVAITGFNFQKKYMAFVHFANGLKRVLRKYLDWRVDIYGGGVNLEICKTMMANALGEEASRVRFLGRQEGVEGVLRNAKIFINLTYRETYPNVVLEAMASGLPIVINRYGGNHEALMGSNETSGKIIETDTELELALNELIESEDLRRRLAESGRRYVEEYHNTETIGREFSDAINFIVSNSNRVLG